MASAMSGYPRPIEINTGDEVYAVTFTANGEFLVSGGLRGVRVWRVKDGEHVATMQMDHRALCVTVSKNGGWIAAGSGGGEVLVWDTTTFKQAFAGKIIGIPTVLYIDGTTPASKHAVPDVDFSPDSLRLVSADGENYTATIWDIAAQDAVGTLEHNKWVGAAKFSPQGDRLATATTESVHIWDSDNKRLLVEIAIRVKPWRGLLWFNDHLFVKTRDSKIKQINPSPEPDIAEWAVPGADSCIALPQHQKFVAHSAGDNVTFWSTSTHTQIAHIPRSSKRCSIAFSPDDRLLAIVAREQRIIIRNLSLIKQPDVDIENAALDAWKHGQLTNAEELLTSAIPTSRDATHHVLACRSLIRARSEQWDAALADAEESITTRSSVIGHIAKCVALVGKGERHRGYRACDIAFHLHSDHLVILLLVKAVVAFMAGEHEDAISRIDDLKTIPFSQTMLGVVQAYMHLLLGKLHMENRKYMRAEQSFQDARTKLGDCTHPPPLIISLISGWKFDELEIAIEQGSCEALLSIGRMREASESVLRMVNQKVDMGELSKTWFINIMQRCLSILEINDNDSRDSMTSLLKEWARLRLVDESWNDTLSVASGFVLSRFTIYQVICERLQMNDRVVDAVACFRQMLSELAPEVDGEQATWTRGKPLHDRYMRPFGSQCCAKLGNIGDIAMNARKYDEAVSRYTMALSLNPASPQGFLCKRSKVHAGKGEWEDAMNDANEAIKLDPSSPLGYERKYAVLYGIGRHDDAMRAFETMLLKMSESADREVRERSRHYVRPMMTLERIRTAVKDTIRDSPPVLINTTSGCLCNKSEQASAFEIAPACTELVSSMTTQIDDTHIQQRVGEYFRYATFSHKWEDNEPLFEKVIRIVVYDLEASPTHEKLQMFCKIVREAGFNWAWSDTCCINKGDHFVLQEALVSMFGWYERSSMTLIFLRGVGRLAKPGALTRNIWNMRAWTLQEYHASKVVRIYTEDWTPYLGLTIYNHKDAPEITSEMEEATGISAQALKALHPGLDDIREKLRLASTRQTTRVEDTAYSLLGIFSTPLPITYGEGDQALGRLLSQLLTSSGDTSILAWTGRSGSFNSCLPSSITVFSQPPTSHIPPAIPDAEITTGLRSLGLALATNLYDRVSDLTAPLFLGRRMRLPCLAFKLGHPSISEDGSERVFRAQANALGVVEFRTEDDLSQLESLYLIHPWVDFLLARHSVGNVSGIIAKDRDDRSILSELPFSLGTPNIAPTLRRTRTTRLMSRIGLPFGGRSAETGSLQPPSTVSLTEKRTRVLQFLTRLRQPFGALLLTRTRQNMEEYRRVASGSLITVRVEELTPVVLERLIQGVRMLDVL